jgi:hypothetical protein
MDHETMTMGQCSRSGAREVIVIVQREDIVGLLTNDTTWRRSCGDSHTTVINRGDWWCSDGKIVSHIRRRDWR